MYGVSPKDEESPPKGGYFSSVRACATCTCMVWEHLFKLRGLKIKLLPLLFFIPIMSSDSSRKGSETEDDRQAFPVWWLCCHLLSSLPVYCHNRPGNKWSKHWENTGPIWSSHYHKNQMLLIDLRLVIHLFLKCFVFIYFNGGLSGDSWTCIPMEKPSSKGKGFVSRTIINLYHVNMR